MQQRRMFAGGMCAGTAGKDGGMEAAGMQGIWPRGSLRAPARGKEEEEVTQPANGAEMAIGSGPCRRIYRGAWSHTSPRPARGVFASNVLLQQRRVGRLVLGSPKS